MDDTRQEPITRARATAYAVALHVVLLGFLLVDLKFDTNSNYYVLHSGPRVIQAYMMDSVPPHMRPVKPHPSAAAIAAAQHEAMLKAQKRAAEKRAKALKLAHQKALKKAQELAAKKQKARLQAEAKARAKAKAQAEAKVKALAAAKAKAAKEAAEKAKAAARAKAKAQALAAQEAAQARGIVDRYRALIVAKVSNAWVQPPNLGAGLSCTVMVHIIAGGEVLSARIVDSSGNAVFDRSVLAAIYNAAPLPVPKSPEKFQYMRHFKFVFTEPGSK